VPRSSGSPNRIALIAAPSMQRISAYLHRSTSSSKGRSVIVGVRWAGLGAGRTLRASRE
jgi:hypothetical protein